MIENESLREIIRELLEKSQFNRDDDYALYADYIKSQLPEAKPTQYYEIMQNHGKYFIYSFKTVERVRRIIQKEAKEKDDTRYMSSRQVEEYRKKLEEEFKNEFVGG